MLLYFLFFLGSDILAYTDELQYHCRDVFLALSVPPALIFTIMIFMGEWGFERLLPWLCTSTFSPDVLS